MKTKLECPYCDGIANLMIEQNERKFRGEIFLIKEHYYKCDDCSNTFTNDETDTIDINQVYNLYREKHNILSQEQITGLREKYNISASRMSRILGFGINSYGNYEKGEIPTLSNSKLIRMIKDPSEFAKLVDESTELESKEKKKILSHLDTLIDAKKSNDADSYCWFLLSQDVNQYTGFIQPSPEKFGHMVLFFLDAAPYKVRLNKLLFYADFLYFKFFGQSISGWKYQALPMGTVPYNYMTSYDYLIKKGFIETTEVLIKNELFDKFVKNMDFNKSLFSSDEIEILESVKFKLGNLKKDEIVKINHQENAWVNEIEKKGLISYITYGFDVKAGNLVDL